MGSSTSAQKPASVIILGLDGAGKTTILKRLRNIENEDTPPTIGIKLEELEPIDGITFHVFDFGGLPKMRPVWKSRLEEMDLEGLIYVVDISDEGRIPESREELFKVLSNEKMIQIPLLVIANKKSQRCVRCLFHRIRYFIPRQLYIFIMGIVSRGKFHSSLHLEEFDEKRRTVNNKMKKILGRTFIRIHVKFPRHYLPDEIHSNDAGTVIFLLSISKTVKSRSLE